MDLIAQLLTDKSSRLGSGPYRAIDYLMKRQGMMNNFVEKPREYDLPCYVYPEAAEDIKSHPFFEGINFKTIHRGQPPFVPKVTGWGDMRYFEDGGDYPFMEDINIDEDEPGSDISHFADGAALPTSKHRENAHTQGESDSNAGASDKKHENKAKRPRARDKILRDLKTGTEAMEIRKHGIFAGYEYVRPNKPRPINPFTGKPLRKVYETATPRPLKYDLEYQLGPLDD